MGLPPPEAALRQLALFVSVLVCWASPAEGQLRTFFVATTGNNANPGTSAAPWQTLQHAANSVIAGDLVIVRPGAYTGFELGTDGTEANPIEFRAEAGVTVNVPNPVRGQHGINLEGASWIVIQGFTVTGMPRAGIRAVLNHHVTIRGNTLDANGFWGVLTGFSDDVLIEDNTASNSEVEHGIYVSNSGDRPTIRRNHVFGNHANGIHMNGDVSLGGDGIISGALVEGNIIHDNGTAGGSGINCDGVQSSRFQNNVLYNNHAGGITLYRIDAGGSAINNVIAHNTVLQASDGRWAINITNASTGNAVFNNILFNAHSFRGSITVSADSVPGLTSDYNVVMDRFSTDDGDTRLTLAQWRAATGQDLHSLIAVPADLFVNAAANDYHLKSTSPARDAGLTLAEVTSDRDGVPRPSGPGVDIGAYEFAVTTSTLTVVRRGSAAGTVTSEPAGISCGATCAASFTTGTQVTLSAAAAAGAVFAQWTGACTGTQSPCTVTVSASMTVTAAFAQPFTDDPLSPAATPVRAVHLSELRAAVDALRSWRSLAAVSWTDPSIAAGVTPVRAVHLAELRTALDAVYAADGLSTPGWTPALSAGFTPVTAAQFEQVRQAIRAVE
jgi:parallel beta-helix repeat protein